MLKPSPDWTRPTSHNYLNNHLLLALLNQKSQEDFQCNKYRIDGMKKRFVWLQPKGFTVFHNSSNGFILPTFLNERLYAQSDCFFLFSFIFHRTFIIFTYWKHIFHMHTAAIWRRTGIQCNIGWIIYSNVPQKGKIFKQETGEYNEKIQIEDGDYQSVCHRNVHGAGDDGWYRRQDLSTPYKIR